VMVSDSMHGVRVRVLPDGRMDRKNAAQYLGCQPKALATWARREKGLAVCSLAAAGFISNVT
jgi:hypothetical protein